MQVVVLYSNKCFIDALGNLLEFILTPGQRNEITQAEGLTENVYNSTVVADKEQHQIECFFSKIKNFLQI